jgi:pyruvate/2-oxoglutarate dehydrogenase complex dihydrolipoamide dehydrogenase (E3) component
MSCSGGRDANSENLGLSSVKAEVLKYGRIKVDENHRTTGYRSPLIINLSVS